MEGMSRIEVGSSCLTLVDLAGSERMTRCRAARLRQPEGAAELQTRKATAATTVGGTADIPIPYRYSNLTRILARSLHCDSSIVLLVTLNPANHAIHQSLHALEFAQRASYLREKQTKKEDFAKKYFPLQHQELLKQYDSGP
ncbi:hypothetical protein Emed_001015 [Eimeria media]